MKALILPLLLLSFFANAQDSLAPPLPPPPPEPVEEAVIFSEVEPEFPGGQQAMMNFIVKNINYPSSAVENGIQGKVYVRFEVAKDGTLENITVARGVSSELDAEAIRVMKLMPKWIPGEQGGKPVRVIMHLPINFRLN